jgi:peptide/nickel transport system permease protein
MARYLLKKVGYGILVLWGVITLIFFLFNVMPDPTRMILGQHTDATSISIVKKDLGLDQPVWKRYINYLNDLSPLALYSIHRNSFFYFDTEKYDRHFILLTTKNRILVFKTPYLRRSYQNKRKVSAIIGDTLFNTFILATLSIFIASVLGIFLGIVSALKKDSFLDKGILLFSSLGMSLPSFFAAILIGWIFAYILGDYTHLNLTGNLFEIDDLGNGYHLMLKNLILPTLTLAIRPLAVFSQLTRNSVLDTLGQDYIRTAYAKGLDFKKVIYRHTLKNSLNPIITTISGWFASLMAGVVFIEYIFGWKGLGYVIVSALNNYDLPVVMGVVLTISVIFVIINIVVDITYTFLDPRIKLSK